MNVRAVLILIFGLLLIRLLGRRAFGKQNPLDIVVSIVVGSNLSRTLTGNSPFLPTLAGTAALVILFWLLELGTARWHSLGYLLKGEPVRLARDHQLDRDAMKRWGSPIGISKKQHAAPACRDWRPLSTPCWSAAAKSARLAKANPQAARGSPPPDHQSWEQALWGASLPRSVLLFGEVPLSRKGRALRCPLYSAAARFGVGSNGKPGWPVNRRPSSHISSACFFIAGRTEAILSVSRSAAIPG
jgi:hypothetical protein